MRHLILFSRKLCEVLFIWASVQPLSNVWLFATSWTAACQAPPSITNSRSLLKLMSIKSVMSSNHLFLCHPLFLLPSIFPRIRIFFSESVLHIRWPKYWSFSFSINPSNEYSELISFRIDWFDLLEVQGILIGLTGLISLKSKGFSRVFSNITVWKHLFFDVQPPLCSNSQIPTWLLE